MQRFVTILALVSVFGCSSGPPPGEGVTAYVGAVVFDGRNDPLPRATILVKDGKVLDVGGAVTPPEGAEVVDLSGKTVTPGFVMGHGHVGGADGLKTGPEVYTRENLVEQLKLYARYGVTTVLSLGGDGELAVELRDAQSTPELDRARIFVAGEIVVGPSPEEAREQVRRNAEMGVDYIKIRVDDNLGSSEKMSPETYAAVIDEAHKHDIPVAAHLYYLEDAKGLLEAGVDFIAHSVRDQAVDDELIAALKEKDVCLCPTLTREVSTFVYESTPEFFSDPFFTKHADPIVLEQLQDPERQAEVQSSRSAQTYKKALEQAKANLKALSDAGVKVVMGTDTGPPARFQGYFEHMELELMADAGMEPLEILRSSTGVAAECLGFGDVGVLEKGRWADFSVFGSDPLADIANSKTLEAVYVSGDRVD